MKNYFNLQDVSSCLHVTVRELVKLRPSLWNIRSSLLDNSLKASQQKQQLSTHGIGCSGTAARVEELWVP